MRILLGLIIVSITIGIGWLGAEISRSALIFIVDLFQILPSPNNYGYFDYLLSHFMIYTLSSMAFAWIAIFLPMIIFKKLNIKVSWKPSIYFLFIWFALIQYKTSMMILSTNQVGNILMKVVIVIANLIGVFWILFTAYKSIDKYSIISDSENKEINEDDS